MVALAVITLCVTAKDLLIQLKSGKEVRYPVENIKEVTFDPTSSEIELPDDPYPSATDFSRNVLLMQHTGTECQHCPIMTKSLRNLAQDDEYASRFTLAALHSYPGDPMGNDLIREISNVYLNGNGYPYVTADFKKSGYGLGSSSNISITTGHLKSLIDNEISNITPSGVAAVAKLDNRTVNVTLSMKAGEDGDYRIGAFVIEDGIYAKQTNSHTDVTGDEDFNTHYNVVRTVIGRDAEGGFSGFDLGAVEKGQTAYTTQDITLGNGWKIENCKLLIYVCERIGDEYICVNSAYAPIDGSTTYKYDSATPTTDDFVSVSKYFPITSNGGEFSIPFTMAEDAKEALVSVSSSDEWIKNVTISDSKITFTADPNTDTATRNGRITVAYGDARPIDISIFQNTEINESSNLFNIETRVLSPYSVSVDFTPTGFTGNYVFMVAKASTIDSYIEAGNLQGWIEGDITWLSDNAEYYGLTLEEFLPSYKQAYSMNGAPITISYSQLKPETEYYAYCYGLNVDGTVTTDFYKKRFTTKMVDLVDLTLSANVYNITTNSATIEVIPSNDNDSYFWTYVSDMDWKLYDINFIMDNMISNILQYVNSGVDINTIIHKGSSGEVAQNLWQGTKYHLVGWGMDEKGTPTSEPKEFGNFTTLDEDVPSDCTFEIEFPQILDNDVQIHITPSDPKERYYVAFVNEDTCEGYNPEQMAQRLLNMENNRFENGFYGDNATWANVEWVFSGEQTKWGRKDLLWTFSPSHAYNVYVFGVDQFGARTTKVVFDTIYTLDPPESDMTIEISLSESDWDHGVFNFKPSNDDEYYIPLLVEDEELQYVTRPDGSLDEAIIAEEIEEYYDHTPNYYTMRGEDSRRFRWNPDTDYTMLVCGWSGGNTTPFYQFKLHTPSVPFNESEADVECNWELFDANELIELDYSRWKDYKDCVVIRLQFKPNEHADFYCGGVWMPVSNYEDVGGEAYLLSLIQDSSVSIVNRPEGMYRTLLYGVTYSLSYIAKDAQGKLGAWHYVEFTPKKGENITPAYNFWSNPSNAPEQIIAVSPNGKSKIIKAPTFRTKADNSHVDAPKFILNSNAPENLGRK